MNRLIFQRNRLLQPDTKPGRAGFSLIEVVVALVLAGSLSLLYISTQQQSIRYLEDIESRLAHINLAQDFLNKKPFYVEQHPTPNWVRMDETAGLQNKPEEEWMMDYVQEDPLDMYVLKVRYKGSIMSWTWVVP